MPLGRALGAGFVGAWGAQAAAGVAVAALLRRGRRPLGAGAVASLATAAIAIIAGSVATSHAAGRLEPGFLLGGATALHGLGVAVWIGGLPCLVPRLKTVSDPCLVDVEGLGAKALERRRFRRRTCLSGREPNQEPQTCDGARGCLRFLPRALSRKTSFG